MRYSSAVLLLAMAGSSSLYAEPWRMVMLPDTQMYSYHTANTPTGPRLFEAQTQWIVDNQQAMNIRFVTHVGDVVDNTTAGQLQAADKAMDILDGKVPYSILPGNHDYNRVGYKTDASALSNYGQYFSPSRMATYQWDGHQELDNDTFYGGSMPSTWKGVTSDINFGNSYSFFKAGGRTYLHLALEWQPDYSGVGAVLGNRGVLNWAQSIIDANPGLPTIVTTHEDLRDADPNVGNGGTTSFGQYVWNNLVKTNDQIFMVLSGHNHFGANSIVNGDGEWRRTDVNNAGHEVFRMMATFQDWPTGGDGYLRLLTIDESLASGNILVETYSPYRNQYLVDFIGPTASRFSYDLDFNARFGEIPEPSSLMLMAASLALMVRRR